MYIQMAMEQMIQAVGELSRERCLQELALVPHMPLDFSAAYLDTQSTEQLRHLLFAALLQARRRYHESQAEKFDRPAA